MHAFTHSYLRLDRLQTSLVLLGKLLVFRVQERFKGRLLLLAHLNQHRLPGQLQIIQQLRSRDVWLYVRERKSRRDGKHKRRLTSQTHDVQSYLTTLSYEIMHRTQNTERPKTAVRSGEQSGTKRENERQEGAKEGGNLELKQQACRA